MGAVSHVPEIDLPHKGICLRHHAQQANDDNPDGEPDCGGNHRQDDEDENDGSQPGHQDQLAVSPKQKGRP